MKIRKIVATLSVLMFLGLGLAACDTQEGPFERGGENVDRGIDRAGDSLERAGERTGDAVDDAGDRMRDTTD